MNAGSGAIGSAWTRLRRRTDGWSGTTRALAWSVAAGATFSLLNALIRSLSQQLDPLQAQFLRYAGGLLVMLPFVARGGWTAWRPQSLGGQFSRGLLHTAGLSLWFLALPHLPLADTTAIGFTTPIFVMLGAWLVFREPMRWERWVAAAIGFCGVLIVVGAQLGGSSGLHHLVMLASAPLFAASFLVTKALTRHESTGVILLWQALSISLFSLPLALWHWQAPTLPQLAGFLLAGVLGNAAHWCLTQSFRAADISATQSVKFLDLVWAAAMGWLVFGDLPTRSALIGGAVICASTLWIARREAARG
ncbi:DMT family transporter [Piscinibacter sakaiensis]|uniref:Membrane protein n=1 Tax=Piscinibacter sakaiensis TaxID=1547922 RepID=A0A0K8NYI5_PISS1|nr:DMT family transporter [Piscinibacter sakaiensis]GAP35433.1 membrane protein [Piscinibacter sakaiensis]